MRCRKTHRAAFCLLLALATLLAGYAVVVLLAAGLERHRNSVAAAPFLAGCRWGLRGALLLLAVLLSAYFLGHLITGLVRFVSGGVLPAWFQDVQAWFA